MAAHADRRGGVPQILLVTGAYSPEVSASGVVCQAVARQLAGRCRFHVLTTAVNRSLPRMERLDDVDVYRIPVDVADRWSKLVAARRVVTHLMTSRFDVLHLHGVSQKNVPATATAKIMGKPIALTLHTAGQEEPIAVRRRGRLLAWALRSADRVLTVSPQLTAAYRAAHLPEAKLREALNGVDTDRFHPANHDERRRLRALVGLPEHATMMLFVGFFSRDKRPDRAYEVFRRLSASRPDLVLLYVGATDGSTYYEIDPSLAPGIVDAAHRDGLADRVLFRKPEIGIDRYYRAADLFVMPSVRESFSLVLLEAMACGLPCVASHLVGATDLLVEDGINGRLVPVDDTNAFTAAVEDLLTDRPAAERLAHGARATAVARFGIAACAERWLQTYRELLGYSSSDSE